MPLAPQWAAVGNPVLDVEHKASGVGRRRQHLVGVRQEPLDVVVRVNPAVSTSVRVRRRREEQVNAARGELGQQVRRVAVNNRVSKHAMQSTRRHSGIVAKGTHKNPEAHWGSGRAGISWTTRGPQTKRKPGV